MTTRIYLFMNKTVIISGGGSGIGYETAKVFLEKLDTVIISGKNKEKLYEAQKQLKLQYPDSKIYAYPADMSNFIDVQLLFEYAIAHTGSVNVLINNCGKWFSKLLSEISDKDIYEAFDNNLKTVIVGTIVANQFMKTVDTYNHIINIGSYAGTIPRQSASLYSCFKSGIVNFTKSSASELIQNHIKVNCVIPGIIETPMTLDSIQKNKYDLIKPVSMSRTGHPREVANTIYWLTTPDSSYINGTSIEVSGGKYLTQL